MAKKIHICPKCKEEIDVLEYIRTSEDSGIFTVDKNGFENYEKQGENDVNEEIYRCPICNETLFEDSDAARLFLL